MNLSNLDGTNGFRLDGGAAGDRSGFAVSSAGDVNGDGLSDLLIGAFGADPNGSASGESYVVFGRNTAQTGPFPASLNLTTLDGANGFRLIGAAAGDRAGRAVSSAGDVNGDGLGDLLIGAPGPDPNPTAGASYVVFGQRTPPPEEPPPSTPLGPPAASDAETELLDLNPRPSASCTFSDDRVITCPEPGGTSSSIVFDTNIPGDARFLQFEFSFEGVDGQALGTESRDAPGTSTDDRRQRINGGDRGALFISNVPVASFPGSIGLPGGGFQSSGQFPLSASGATTATVRNFPSGAPGSVFRIRNIRIDRCREKCFKQSATICGSNGPDTLSGTSGRDVIVGRGGNDRINGQGGKDRICGGTGNDRLLGGKGNDMLRGGEGKDRLRGGPGNDRLNGGLGRDRCDGGPGDDTVARCERRLRIP